MKLVFNNITQKNKEIISLNKNKFYKNDILDIQKYPDEIIQLYYDKQNPYANYHKTIIDLSNIEEPLKTQLKDFHYLFLMNYKEDFYVEYLKGYKTVNDNKTLKTFRHYYNIFNDLVVLLSKTQIKDIYSISNLDNFDKKCKLLILKIRNSLDIYYEKNYGFEKDLWIVNNDFTLIKERINCGKGEYKKSIDFRNIENEHNREIIKKYMKYLIVLTNYNLSTIIAKKYVCSIFVNKILKEKKIENSNREDIEKFINYISSKYSRWNDYVCELKQFYEWLSINNFIDEIIVYNNDFNCKHSQKISAIDDFVINQIFNNLDKIDEKYRLIFLLNYSTGLRISEICILKKDLLYKENEHYYIRFYSQKMKKEVTNEICETLYLMLEEYIKNLANNGCEYLFTTNQKDAILSNTISRHLNDAFKKLEIKDKNGNIYKYRSHDYRHTIATKMVELDIPIQIIQKVLHHESPEMTLAYAEIRETHKIKKFKDFVNAQGELAPLEEFKDIEDELITAEWIRQNINAQILPNGYCGMPIKLGKCPHANSCLECTNFRTSIEFLDEHKKQLAKTNELIEICEKNNWLPQLETNKKNALILENLINKLENGE